MNAKFYKVKSLTTKGKEYIVREMPDGGWRCECPRFVFQARGSEEDCKHITRLKNEMQRLPQKAK